MLNTKEIQDWLVTRVAELLHVDTETIDISLAFSYYGLTSLDVVALSGELEELLGCRLSPTLAYDYPSIQTLSDFLGRETGTQNSLPPKEQFTDRLKEPIAVIGIGCRFPGATNPESFWRILHDGLDMITEIPADRWNKHDFYHPDPSVPGKSVSYWGGFLDNIDQFDPFFFGISPIEAKYMDPQQRLLLELSYEALDNAGLTKENVNGSKTGVFIGIALSEYSQMQFADVSMITSHSGTGSALSVAANRISYYFNLHGPSVAIDTACSSSLAAVHLACQSIRNGECTLALAGGVNLILSPANSIAFTKAGVLAPDGRCKSFDADAKGYVRGEGGGVIVLKSLSSALADGDPIQAVLLGSAMRHDGRTNGLMAPSAEAQEALLRDAYREAGVLPGMIQYIESHGTGTILGDSIEAKAIGSVLGADRNDSACLIGSVKTNIGHLEAAAGIAGLIKVILSLKNKTIPASLHYRSPNPHIHFSEINVCVNSQLSPWPADSCPALAGVSSFGFGGTNVHMVVSEANHTGGTGERKNNDDFVNSYVLPLSASSPDGLRSLADSILALISPGSRVDTNDVCYAAAKRRIQFDHCLAVIGNSREELRANLKAFVQGEQAANVFTGTRTSHQQRKVVFVFSGQGGQWYGMGRELLKGEPVFFNAIERIDRIIKNHFSWSLINELSAERSVSRMTDIDVIQPTLFAIQVALTKLWEHWGIKPDAVIGHSMGEVAAAHISGVLSLKDAVHIVCHRSQLLKQLCGRGSMMATELSPEQASEILKKYGNDITLAAINSPVSTVLSGSTETIAKVMEDLQHQNVFCKLVNVDVASHSPQIDVLRSELQKVLSSLDPQRATVPFYSTVTGTHDNNIIFNDNYWIDNLRKPVLFFDGITNLLQSGHSTFIEMGPHPILLSSIQQTLYNGSHDAILLPSLRREEPERLSMLSTLGTLYSEGYSINWNNLYPHCGKHVPLPNISWERQRYWLDIKSPTFKNQKYAGSTVHPLLGDRINLANSPLRFIWQTVLNEEMMQLLEQHKIENEIVFPAAAYIEMALQAAKETNLDILHELFDFNIKESMTIRSTQSPLIQTVLTDDKNNSFLLTIYSQMAPGEQWILHASAHFIPKIKTDSATAPIEDIHHVIRRRCTSEFTSVVFYQTLHSHGIQYGPSFQAVEHVWSGENESLGLINFPTSYKHDNTFQIHPALLDACLQVLAATQIDSSEHDLYIPTGCRHIRFFSKATTTLWSHVSVSTGQTPSVDVVYADIRLSDDNGHVIGELTGFRLQRTSRRVRKLIAQRDIWLYQPRWLARQPVDSPLSPHKKKHWLIFADDQGFGEELAKQLESNGDHCHLLLFRDVFTKPGSFEEDALYAAIEKSIQNSFASLHGVVHFWSLSIPQSSAHEPVMSDLTLMPGVNSVLFVLQSLTKRIASLPKLWLITRGTQSVQSDEEIAVEQSVLWGFGKVISLELPALKCTRVDLDSKHTIEDGIPDIVRMISSDDGEDQVAFRAGRRFVHRLLPFTYNKPYKKAISFRSDRTYLITGGLGALGIRVAGWLAQRGGQHIVLLGRSDPSPSVINFIEKLRRDGVNVFVARADISNDVQLRNVMEEIETNMPELKGIFHAAGVLDDCSISNLTTEKMKKVMASKVVGTWNLHKATLKVPLDFFVLFSSAVSVLGSPGQGNYAAANSYLDAMAYFRRSCGLPAISINWGPWAEVGLAAQASEKIADRNASNDHLVKAIKIDQGLEILEQLIMEPTPQVMVLPFDLKNLIELYPTAAGIPFFAEVGGRETHVARLYARPNLRHKYVEPRNEMESKLADLWRHTLHIDRVGVHDSFFELGGDSILAAQILSLAQKAFGIRINPQDVFHAFTIEQLAEKLQNQILNEVEEMSEEEAERKIYK